MKLEYLKSILHYNPKIGIWGWLVSKAHRIKIGQKAGAINYYGYRTIKIDGKTYLASRLAWFYMTNEWPPVEVEHKDRNTLNDKWSNLRLATHSQNMCNKKALQRNKLGVKGVHYIKSCGLFRAQIQINKKKKNLGNFKLLEDAKKAYQDAANELHKEFSCY